MHYFITKKKEIYFDHISLSKSSAHEDASLGDLSKQRWLGPSSRVCDRLGGAREYALLMSSQVMLLLPG